MTELPRLFCHQLVERMNGEGGYVSHIYYCTLCGNRHETGREPIPRCPRPWWSRLNTWLRRPTP